MPVPTNSVARVDFFAGTTVLCSGASYTCAWKVPAGSNKTYTLKVVAVDTQGAAGPASTETVIAK